MQQDVGAVRCLFRAGFLQFVVAQTILAGNENHPRRGYPGQVDGVMSGTVSGEPGSAWTTPRVQRAAESIAQHNNSLRDATDADGKTRQRRAVTRCMLFAAGYRSVRERDRRRQ